MRKKNNNTVSLIFTGLGGLVRGLDPWLSVTQQETEQFVVAGVVLVAPLIGDGVLASKPSKISFCAESSTSIVWCVWTLPQTVELCM